MQYSMNQFEYTSHPARVVFGTGSLSKLPNELSRLNASAPLLLSGPRQASQVSKINDDVLSGKAAGIFSGAKMHTPTDVTAQAMDVLNGLNPKPDSLVSIGGGSSIGLGKALAIRTGLPHIAVPTTYAGSEMTHHLGETENGRKVTKKDPRIVPQGVIYDAQLTLSLPVETSVLSGLNGIAHAVEALYAQNANPITTQHAISGITAFANSLPRICSMPSETSSRSEALYGAFMCSLCVATVGTALHHKMAHVLGGSFNMPHMETHSLLLPHSLAYNIGAIPPPLIVSLSQALSGGEESSLDPVQALDAFLDRTKVARGLSRYGFKEEDVEKAAEIVAEGGFYNPKPVQRDRVREAIWRAWAGERARADL